MSSNQYILHYFNARGAAEGIRLLFAAKGIHYEDKRYEREEWKAKKPEMPQKMMPALEIDGKMYCQSGAIFRYLGREHGLYGKNNLEALLIDEICETIIDMTNGLRSLFNEADEAKKAEGMRKVLDETFPNFVPFIADKLKDKDNGFLVGDKLSIADIAVYRILEFLYDFIQPYLKDYDRFLGRPELQTHTENIEKMPNIKAWIEKRPKTKM